MKSFRQVLGEVAQPKPEEERAFKDMHSYETMPHPVALDHQFTGAIGADDLPREKAKRIADQEGDANYDTAYDDAFEYAGPSFAEEAIARRIARIEESKMAKAAALSKASATSKSGKAKVSLKKAPWDKNEEVELDEASASVYKDMPKAPGKMVSNRVQVKAFKDTNAMGAFLSKQNDNSWQDTGVAGLKSGKYKIDMVKKGGKPSKNFIKVNEEVDLEEASIKRSDAIIAARNARIAAGVGKSPAKTYEIKDNKIHISKANFRKVHKDGKNATKGKERMVALDPKTGGTVSFPVVFTESVELDEGFSPKQIEQLKKAYASMPDRVPMDMANKMSAVLKGRSKEELIAIARADIKWLSTTAATTLIMQGVKAKEING